MGNANQYEHLDYQKQAIDSIVDLFQGEITHHQDDFSLSDKDNVRVIANELSLSKDDIFDNLKNIQTQNQLSLSDKLDSLYFSVEMETGTGKTFVYLNTVFELYQRYGRGENLSLLYQVLPFVRVCYKL